MHNRPYWRLLAMTALSFAAMYVLMYAMVNALANAIPNLNQFYMAGLMVAPMVIIELVVMRSMYPSRRWNGAIVAASIAALAVLWVGIRQQVAITDREFLKSMIPHHAAAILMCEKAEPRAPEIKKLCSGIVSSQQAEIDQMKGLLGKGG
jgi:uncharacterized protein (DUF305 family)